MDKQKAFVILSPAFAGDEADSKMPSQEVWVRMLNRLYPSLKIIIITFHFPVKKEPVYSWYGNKVIAANGAMKGGWHSPLLWMRVWQQLKRLRKDYRITGLFSFFCSECAFVGHHFARRYKLQHRIWIMGQDAKADNRQVKRIRPKAEELVTISDFLQRTFEQHHHIRPAQVVPIGIDASLFGPAPPQRDIDLMGAGSLIPLKQFDLFVAIVADIKQRTGKVRACIAGNGPEEALIRNKISSLDLEEQVSLAGKMTQRDTLAMMQRCKVLLHTSSYEGLGMVCLEALYAGAKVISFCKPLDKDIPEWYQVHTPEEMVAQAVILLNDTAAEYKPVMPYSMEDTARNIISLFGPEAY